MRIDYDCGYYIGDVDSNDNPHGYGVLYDNSSIKIFQGDWVHGKITGKGTLYFTNGDRYEGDFLNGELHGKGTLYRRDGGTYEGNWKDFGNATNVVYTHGSNFDRGQIVNHKFVCEVQQWSTKGSSYSAAIHPNNNTVEHGSYHNNDNSARGALNHIHYNDGSEMLLEDCGNQIKVTYKKNGTSRVEYMPKLSSKNENIERAKKLFNK